MPACLSLNGVSFIHRLHPRAPPPVGDPGHASSGVRISGVSPLPVAEWAPPRRRPGNSTLRELEPLAGTRATRLLPLDLTRVTGQHALLAQGLPQVRVRLEQRAGDTQPDRTGLPRRPPAIHVALHV